MAQVCRSWLFCRRRLVAWVHFWYGRCFLLAYWGRGCLLAWILRTGSSLACRPQNLLILQWETGSWLIWSRTFPWWTRSCRGWERSGFSSAFCVKTAQTFRWVVEDSRCAMVKEYSWLSSWCWIFPLRIIVECSTSLNLERVQSVKFWLS